MAVAMLVAVVTRRGAPFGPGLTGRVADFVTHGPTGLVGLLANVVDAGPNVAHQGPDESPDILGHAPELVVGRHTCRVSRRTMRRHQPAGGDQDPPLVGVSGAAVHVPEAVDNVGT